MRARSTRMSWMFGGGFRGVWRVSGAIAVFALLLAGCGGGRAAASTTGSPTGGTPTSRGAGPTATPLPALTWHTVTLPPNLTAAPSGGPVLAVSPVDGHDAWLCVPGNGSSFAIWASTDTGATWHRVGTLTPTTPQSPSCTLTPDQLDTNTLVAGMTWGCGECQTLRSASYLSSDGGATWHAVPGDYQVQQIATRGGKNYAIVFDTASTSSASPAAGVAISGDGLRTWQLSRPSGATSSAIFYQVWLNPTSSEVLAATEDNTLWRSPDAGATWTRVSTPATQITLGKWIAAQHHWLLCGVAPDSETHLVCSTDLGATWTPRPILADTYTCANCGKDNAPSGGTQPCPIVAATATGALLDTCAPNGTIPDPTNFALYQLLPGAAAWVSLGAAPGPWLTVPATGPVWCANGQEGGVGTYATADLPAA